MEEVTLYLDCREQKLASLINDTYVSCQLEIGDVQIKVNDQIFILIERKTLADLAASIKDNRYKEQKQRILNTTNPDVKIIYVLEGTYSFSPDMVYAGLSNGTMSGSIINSMLRDNIFIVQTRSVADSADFITGIFQRVKKDPAKYMNTARQIGYNPTSSVSVKKKENINKHECMLLQLCCIPGISNKKAQAICEALKLSDLASLIVTLKEAPLPIKLLTTVPGIGKTLADSIVKYMM